jgi:hypothetical protein
MTGVESRPMKEVSTIPKATPHEKISHQRLNMI